jgi:hypothetical protein
MKEKNNVMKKMFFKSIFFLFTVFLVNYSNAQVAFGPKVGVNLTTLNVDDPEASYDSRTGYHAGVFLRGRFDRIAIQPEVLLFTHQNELTYMAGLATAENKFTYLSVPVMLKFYILSGLNIQAGPQFSFLLDGTQHYTEPLFKGERDITEYYKKSDVSVSAGGGFDFKFGLNVDFRYNIGVKDINNLPDGNETKSSTFLISLGWNFLRN